MTLEELEVVEQKPEFGLLRETQKVWLRAYLRSGDLEIAAKAAYAVKDQREAMAASNSLLANKKIRAILGLPEVARKRPRLMSETEFVAILSDRLRNPGLNDRQFSQYAKLLAKAQGWGGRAKAKKEKPQKLSSLDRLVLAREIERRAQ